MSGDRFIEPSKKILEKNSMFQRLHLHESTVSSNNKGIWINWLCWIKTKRLDVFFFGDFLLVSGSLSDLPQTFWEHHHHHCFFETTGVLLRSPEGNPNLPPSKSSTVSHQVRSTFHFDDVLTSFSSQEDVFRATLQPLVGQVRGHVFRWLEPNPSPTYKNEKRHNLDDILVLTAKNPQIWAFGVTLAAQRPNFYEEGKKVVHLS